MKKKTLSRYPKAFAYQWTGNWVIYVPHNLLGNVSIGQGKSAALAWKDAAKFRGSLFNQYSRPRRVSRSKASTTASHLTQNP